MAFWRKKRIAGGKHRGISRKEAKSLPSPHLEAEEFTLNTLKVEDEESLPLPDVPLQTEEIDDIGTFLIDEFKASKVSNDIMCSLLILLQRRSLILDRLRSLEIRFSKVNEKTEKHGLLLQEMKLDKLMSDLTNPDDDVAEKKVETFNEVEGFVKHRERMKHSVLLLTQLDSTLNKLIEDHDLLSSEFNSLFLEAGFKPSDDVVVEMEDCSRRLSLLSLTDEPIDDETKAVIAAELEQGAREGSSAVLLDSRDSHFNLK